MKKCRFNRPDIIASYYDGTLPEKEKMEFEAHFYTCRDCMDALLSLEKDLFFMERMGRLQTSRPIARRAFFEIVKNSLRLVKNLDCPPLFEPVVPVPVRGEEVGKYRVEKKGVTVDIKASDGGSFDI